ncbi:carboxypeptidase regulatory-like domain-containing protein [uncultured Muribaculum sp.]|uniref:TonB-dependent receptor n=1 Tax=uncultured Muribaculum sp. TaxID=1918613 RepID=UPI0026F30039|nr:carboxypeptidase regulatory-like domain-containing protein [uncultured Muribaculum sp.]
MTRILHILLMIALAGITAVHAQIRLTGTIKAEGEALPFAHVDLFTPADSTKSIAGAVTDFNGSYSINNLKPGRYTIAVSYLGYETVKETLRLRMPSGGNTVTRDYTLSPSATQLSEVTVTADRVSVMPDKTVYRFTKAQREAARNSADLMEHVGTLSIDPISGNLTEVSGEPVKILINGLNSTLNDLRAIPADKIRKVDVYTLPPARYASSGQKVINVVTGQLDTGVNGGFNVISAVATGFVNGNAFLTYTSGNHRLAADYKIELRDYDDRRSTRDYTYWLGGRTYRYNYYTRDHFGYTYHTPRLKYTYSKPEDLTLQVIASPSFNKRFSRGDQTVGISYDATSSEAKGYSDNNSTTFSPSLDIYLSKQLSKSSEISANVVGTYFHSSQDRDKTLNAGEGSPDTYTDLMDQKVNRYSIIGEVDYTYKRGFNSLNVGFRTSVSQSWSDTRNILSDYDFSRYRSDDTDNYLYAEYSGLWKKMMFSVSLGGHIAHAKNDDASYTRFLFTPRLVLSRTFARHHTLRLMFQSSPEIPSISQLSDNAVLQTPRMIHAGNPYLHSGTNYQPALVYQLASKRINLSAALMYSYTHSPIEMSYREALLDGQPYVIASEVNIKSSSYYGGGASLQLEIIPDMLTFVGYIFPMRQSVEIDGVKSSQWSVANSYGLRFRKGKWGAQYSGAVPYKTLSGSYVSKEYLQSNIDIFWQHRGLRLTLGCYWLGTQAEYRNSTTPNRYFHEDNHTVIRNNRSMVTLGVSWDFSYGKKKEDIKRKLNNSDTDTGLFE